MLNISGLTNKSRDSGSLYFYFIAETKIVFLWDNSVGKSHIVDQGFIVDG